MSTSEERPQLEFAILDGTRRAIAAAILYSHQVSEQLKLGPSDAQFMTLLDIHGPLTPGRLAELTGLKTGTVTGVLDRLEKAGLVRRERDPHDRRKVIVSAEPKVISERVAPHYAEQANKMADLLGRYSDEELALIGDFMRAVGSAQWPINSAPPGQTPEKYAS